MRKKGIGMTVVFIVGLALFMGGCAQKKVAEEIQSSTQQEQEMKMAQPSGTQGGVVGETPAKADTEGLENQIAEFENTYVYFDYDRYTLSPQAKEILKSKAAFLKSHTDMALRIQGNCDERGTTEYNMALGERRARSAQEYLISLGVSKGRITTVSYGEERPVDPGHDENAWSKNRNDQFIIANK